MFVSRVKGEFPLEGEDTLIPLNWCEQAVARWNKNADKKPLTDHVYLGLDVARYGTNKTVLTRYVSPRVEVIKSIQNRSTTNAVNLVIGEAVTAGAKLQQITTDDTGVGGGVTDRLRELGYPVLPVNFSQKPSDPFHFKAIRDEMYWHMRELFRSGEIEIPPNENLIAQLSAIKYKIDPKKGRIEIESKDDMKKRGLSSPDETDSLSITLYGAKRQRGSSSFRSKARTSRYQPSDAVYY